MFTKIIIAVLMTKIVFVAVLGTYALIKLKKNPFTMPNEFYEEDDWEEDS